MPQFDPFDPEEIRRRRLLGMDDMMGEDEQDTPEISTAQTSNATPSLLTPSQLRYKTLLDQAPDPNTFQPTQGRRVLAAIAGGLAGLKDAKTGMEVGSTIRNQPYQGALQRWQSQMQGAGLGLELDKEVNAQDVARRRAGAYEESARARTTTAAGYEQWRRYQQEHTPWSPQTKDEFMETEKAKHPAPKASRLEEEKQWMQDDPQGFQKYNDLKHRPQRSLEEQQQMIEFTQKMRAKYHAPKEPKVIPPASPQQQSQAEHLAAQQLVRENPQFAPFYIQGQGKTPPRFLGLDEISALKGMASPEQQSLARSQHALFQNKVRERSRNILSNKAPGSEWEIQEK